MYFIPNSDPECYSNKLDPSHLVTFSNLLYILSWVDCNHSFLFLSDTSGNNHVLLL